MNVLMLAALAAVTDGYVRPCFNLPDDVYAAPGIECNIYFANVFDTVNPARFAFETRGKIGRCQEERWTWTPGPADSGRHERLVLNAWTDEGLFAAKTVTVHVARAKADPNRRITSALLADSLTNARYQDRMMEVIRAAGWKGYEPIGSHCGDSAAKVGVRVPGAAMHDGFGGWTARTFLEQYAVAVDEIDNLQAKAEREQLERFGMKIPSGQEWRKNLLKSPFVRIVNGKKRFDVRYWLDAVNGGKAPDFLVIALGTNGSCSERDETIVAGVSNTVYVLTKRLIDEIRAVCPETKIALASCPLGDGQDAFGDNYGNALSAVQCHKNLFRLNAHYARLVAAYRAAGDRRVFYVPFAGALARSDGYLTASRPVFVHSKEKRMRGVNAVHPSLEGGRQLGDALAGWILNELGEL